MKKKRKYPAQSGFLASMRAAEHLDMELPLEDTEAVLAIWSLRTLLRLEGLKNGYGSHFGFSPEDLDGEFLGIDGPIPEDWNFDDCICLLEQRLALLERQAPGFDAVLDFNLHRLSRHLGLNEVESRLLVFLVMLGAERRLARIADSIPDHYISARRIYFTLAEILDFSESEVRQALSREARLFRLGLVRLNPGWPRDLESFFEVMEGLDDALLLEHENVYAMLQSFFTEMQPSSLQWEDYDYLSRSVEDLFSYLKAQLEDSEPGSNVLIHGQPGTGKTELARLLVQRLSAQGFEIGNADPHGEPKPGKERIKALSLAQGVLEKESNSVLVFDEIEDVFSDHFDFLDLFLGRQRRGAGGYSKGWFNQLLESNPVPTLWISNRVDGLDPALLRRFDFVLELPNPPQPVRRRVLQRSLPEGLVSERWLDRVSQHEPVTPALMDRAARVALRMGCEQQEQAEEAMTRRINAWCRAMSLPPLKPRGSQPMTYRPDLLNTDLPIEEVIDGLCESGFGRLCLYGVPGSGKTAMGRHLAERLQRPLLVKRASSLLDKFVGETEKRIAKMFEEAEMQQAVLMLDEADSLLRSRSSARNRWEVTQVNELLTQMETFEGVFICSTNLMDELDEATLRRFDIKIRFDALTREQSWGLFHQVLQDHEQESDDGEWKSRLAVLEGLTPGDFATVIRRLTISRKPCTAGNLFQGLRDELALRQQRNGRSIGFTTALA